MRDKDGREKKGQKAVKPHMIRALSYGFENQTFISPDPRTVIKEGKNI